MIKFFEKFLYFTPKNGDVIMFCNACNCSIETEICENSPYLQCQECKSKKLSRIMGGYAEKILNEKKKNDIEIKKAKAVDTFFSTHLLPDFKNQQDAYKFAVDRTFQRDVSMDVMKETGATMDSSSQNYLKQPWVQNQPINQELLAWYGSQSFIGYQACVILSQHWLILKCCSMPAKDAVRKGYDVTVNDGVELQNKEQIFDDIRKADKKYKVRGNMVKFVTKGRMYGVRVCIFLVEFPSRQQEDEYYRNPFNIDAVKPGTYRGMLQIDPFWVTPQLDNNASGNPASQDFYEPTCWLVNGRLYHRTHLVVFRCDELPDTLKPTYVYGSVSIPQKIYERVYAAERTANEAPLLALTKRTLVRKMDSARALSQGQKFFDSLQLQVLMKNNYGQQIIDLDDEVEQFDTALADLDAVIMTQYQIVAAAAGVPSTKLLGTSPKGFNTTGEFEEANYHEELETIQSHDLSPLLDRHHELVIKSDIAPKYGIESFQVTHVWKPLDSMTAKEEAEVNNIKADTDLKISQTGAIDGNDIRSRIAEDPNSGYSGIEGGAPDPQPEKNPDDLNDNEGDGNEPDSQNS